MATLAEQRKSRTNGLMLPLHPLQFIAWFMIMLFTIFYFGATIFNIPSSWRTVGIVIPAVTFGVHIIFHIICLLLDPADASVRAKTSSARTNLRIFNKNVQKHVIENSYCYICEVKVCSSSKHCSACNKCVSEFDHHCKWLNNCVGGRNYKLFLLCIFTALISTSFVFGMSLYQFIISINGGIFVMFNTTVNVAYPIVTGIVGLLALIVAGLIGHLFFFHIYLMCNGLTTYSYIIGERQRQSSVDTDSNKSDKQQNGCCGRFKRKAKVSPKDTEKGNGDFSCDTINRKVNRKAEVENSKQLAPANGNSTRKKPSNLHEAHINHDSQVTDSNGIHVDKHLSNDRKHHSDTEQTNSTNKHDNLSRKNKSQIEADEKDYSLEIDIYTGSDYTDNKPLLKEHNNSHHVDRSKERTTKLAKEKWNNNLDTTTSNTHDRHLANNEIVEIMHKNNISQDSQLRKEDNTRHINKPITNGQPMHINGASSSESLQEIPVAEVTSDNHGIGTTYVDVEGVLSRNLSLQTTRISNSRERAEKNTSDTAHKSHGRPLPQLPSLVSSPDGRITPRSIDSPRLVSSRSIHSSESQKRRSPRSAHSTESPRLTSLRFQYPENGKNSTESHTKDELPSKSRSSSSFKQNSPRSRSRNSTDSTGNMSGKGNARRSPRGTPSSSNSISRVTDRATSGSPTHSNTTKKRKKKRKPINQTAASDDITSRRTNASNRQSSVIRSSEMLARPGPLPSVNIKGRQGKVFPVDTNIN